VPVTVPFFQARVLSHQKSMESPTSTSPMRRLVYLILRVVILLLYCSCYEY